MSVEQEEYFLLHVAVDATHGDVDAVVAVDEVHARYIGRQNLLQVTPATIVDHLLGDQRGRHRHFIQALRHT